MDIQNSIVLRDLTIGYSNGKHTSEVLSKINLSGTKGELIALMGENGSGKSTLLKTIIGELPVIGGEIEINGTLLSDIKPAQKAEIVSYVSTETARISNMSVESLIELGRYKNFNWVGKVARGDKEGVENVIEKCGLNALRNRYLNQLSDGERQRVMIARALAQDTPIILLDEPTAFLDVNNKYAIAEMLKTLTDDIGKTVLFSTHDINMVINEVDKVWLVHDERIYQGAPEELVMDGIFQQLFVNKSVYFDQNTGEIGIKKHLKGSIQIKADKNEIYWIGKALTRIAYRIDFEKPDLLLEYENEIFILTDVEDGEKLQFHSLYDTCRFLKSNEL